MMVRKLVRCILVQFKPATGVKTSYWSSIPEKLNQDRRERNREHGSSCTSILYSHRSQPGGNSCILILCFYSLHSFPSSFISFLPGGNSCILILCFYSLHSFPYSFIPFFFPLLPSIRFFSTSFFIPFPVHFFFYSVPFPLLSLFRFFSTSYLIQFLFQFFLFHVFLHSINLSFFQSVYSLFVHILFLHSSLIFS